MNFPPASPPAVVTPAMPALSQPAGTAAGAARLLAAAVETVVYAASVRPPAPARRHYGEREPVAIWRSRGSGKAPQRRGRGQLRA